MKVSGIVGGVVLGSAVWVSSAAQAQIDTYHVFKDGAVAITRPGMFTDVAFVDVPRVGVYFVVAKTEIQNMGADNQVTCELAALDTCNNNAPFAGDPVSVFVGGQGKFGAFPLTLVVPQPLQKPDCGFNAIRLRLRCGSLWTSSPTNLAARQTKITAHAVSGAKIVSQ